MRTRLFITGLAMLTLLSPACKKGSTHERFTATIRIMDCGTAVIDIDGSPGTGGGATWAASSTVTYNNAARVSNYCYLVSQGVKAGDVITFSASGDAPTADPLCMTTPCYVNGPSNKVLLFDVQKVKLVD